VLGENDVHVILDLPENLNCGRHLVGRDVNRGDHLFTFLDHDGVDAANNLAERQPTSQSLVVEERLFYMVANQEIVAAINEQMGNEFSAMLAVLRHRPLILARKRCPSVSAHFYKQAEEEKEHALRFIQFVIDIGARVKIPAVTAPQAHFEVAEDAVKLPGRQSWPDWRDW